MTILVAYRDILVQIPLVNAMLALRKGQDFKPQKR